MSSDPNSLEGFWSVVVALTEDAKTCIGVLDKVYDDDDDDAVMFWRRMYARSVIALIEGATYRMTYAAYLARDRRDVTFSLSEMQELEKAYDFEEEFDPVVEVSRALALDRIQLAFKVFARVHYSDYVLPIQEAEWAHIKEIFRIKQTLMFPREAQELAIDEEKVDALIFGTTWFMERLVNILQSSRTSMLEQVASWENEDDDGIVM
jgi:hypothetical protein